MGKLTNFLVIISLREAEIGDSYFAVHQREVGDDRALWLAEFRNYKDAVLFAQAKVVEFEKTGHASFTLDNTGILLHKAGG